MKSGFKMAKSEWNEPSKRGKSRLRPRSTEFETEKEKNARRGNEKQKLQQFIDEELEFDEETKGEELDFLDAEREYSLEMEENFL